MAKGFKKGGYNPLNFKVMAYATEEDLNAATPKENTIGVITAVPISTWTFSATEPTEPMEGMVWISTGTDSPAAFNALKKNDIQVYPVFAKQYIGGAWVDKTAKSWQGGEWVDWMLRIYDNGFINEGAIERFEQVVAAAAQLTWEANKIAFSYINSGGRYVTIYTKRPIPVDSYKKLYIDVGDVTVGTNGVFIAGLRSTPEASENVPSASSFAASISTNKSISKQVLDVDISNVSGDYYIQIAASIAKGEIYKIYLK